MRVLYHIPIIHAALDQGGFGEKIKKSRMQRVGERKSEEIEQNILQLWEEVRRRIQKKFPDPKGLRMYQDSLCVELRGQVIEALQSGKNFESPNDQLLKELYERGATIEGTESLVLVGECISIFKKAAQAPTIKEQTEILERHAGRLTTLFGERDGFIAKRIDLTLEENEQGILFMGKAHKVIEALHRLSKTNQLRSPIDIQEL